MVFCHNCGLPIHDSAHFCGICGSTQPLHVMEAEGLPAYRTIGPYRLVAVVGSGSSGPVWLAYGPESGPLAVKALSPELRAVPDFLACIRQEARALASLDHPNVVTLRDYLETEEGAFVVMDFVEGSSLRTLERAVGVLAPEQALGVLVGVLSALGYAHGLGLVHGDVKPDNVLLDARGTSKLVDFGQVAQAGAGTAWGRTPAYMSPEAARGGPVDQRADLYGAGVMLYEALAGNLPFGAITTLLFCVCT